MAPKDGEKNSKTHEGKEFHWCQNHKAWVRHKPSDCKGIDFRGSSDGNHGIDNKKSDGKPKMKLSKALAVISDDEDE